jgi:hypothetical protein
LKKDRRGHGYVLNLSVAETFLSASYWAPRGHSDRTGQLPAKRSLAVAEDPEEFDALSSHITVGGAEVAMCFYTKVASSKIVDRRERSLILATLRVYVRSKCKTLVEHEHPVRLAHVGVLTMTPRCFVFVPGGL